jgi:all-trans-8'-apo-beta-carotenal 15,15'-oxygenase
MSSAAWPIRAFAPQQERDMTIERVDGRVPEELRGTFFRIGPGTLDVAGEMNAHWFDGDGMICAFSFERGRITFKNRFVETPWRERERAAGRRLFSSFAALAPTLRDHLRRPKNPANTNVVAHGDRLLALYEAGRPFALDPSSLETIGEASFEGTLPPWATFSAHPHRDRGTGNLVSVGLGVRFGRSGLTPVAEVWEVSASGRARRARSIPLRHADVIHSVGLTRRHIVILLGPYGVDWRKLPGFAARRRGMFDVVAWRPHDPLTVYVAERHRDTPPRIYELPTAFMIHVANAYDDEAKGDVVVDAILHPDPGLIESIRLPFTDPKGRAGRLTRVCLRARGDFEARELSPVGVEFPAILPAKDGTPHRFTYAGKLDRDDERTCGASPFLVKVDTETGRTVEHTLGDGCLWGEPVIVPRPSARAEDDGWALLLAYDGRDHHSFVAILRADSWDEVARVHLPFHVPMGLHATFVA